MRVKPDDEVILYAEPEGDKLNNVYIEDFARDNKLLYLVVLFIILLVMWEENRIKFKQAIHQLGTFDF